MHLPVKLILILVIFMTLPSFSPITQSAVEQLGGSTLHVGGSGPGNYSTIQSAINDANNGDIIFIYNNNYFENIIVNKSINIIGEEKDITIINSVDDYSTISIQSSDVLLKGLTIRDSPKWGVDVYNSDGCSNISIVDCMIDYNHGGILLVNTTNSTIDACTIKNNLGLSVYLLHDSSNILIKNSNLANNGYLIDENWYHPGGILMDGCGYQCADISVIDCIIKDNIGSGIDLFQCLNISLNTNHIINNTRSGVTIASIEECTIIGNVIQDNFHTGILVHGEHCQNVAIECNNIVNNGDNSTFDGGLYIADCSGGVIIRKNQFTLNNPFGVYLLRSNKIKIYENNFINNTYNAFFIQEGFMQCSRWYGNYWNKCTSLPYIIRGKVQFIDSLIHWINMDIRPSKKEIVI